MKNKIIVLVISFRSCLAKGTNCLLCFDCITIPPSRLRRATSLYTREALVLCKPGRQIQVCLPELYSHTTQKSRFPHKLPLPAHICKSSYNGGSGIFMPILSVFAPLLKSRFFVIYYRCVTLADGMDFFPVCRACIRY